MSKTTTRIRGARRRVHAVVLGTALFSAAWLTAAGCMHMNKPQPEKHSHSLAVTRGGTAEAAVVPGSVLKVRAFEPAPRCPGRELVYRRSETGFDEDYYNIFLSPPGAMIAEIARAWMAESGRFDKVVDLQSRAVATHMLEGSLTTLEGDYRDRSAPRAALGLTLTLLDSAAAVPRVVFQKDYYQAVPVPAMGPPGLVEGWNTALRNILNAFEYDVARALVDPKAEAKKDDNAATTP